MGWRTPFLTLNLVLVGNSILEQTSLLFSTHKNTPYFIFSFFPRPWIFIEMLILWKSLILQVFVVFSMWPTMGRTS